MVSEGSAPGVAEESDRQGAAMEDVWDVGPGEKGFRFVEVAEAVERSLGGCGERGGFAFVEVGGAVRGVRTAEGWRRLGSHEWRPGKEVSAYTKASDRGCPRSEAPY